MEKAERQLEALLEGIEGLDYARYPDHESIEWVQTGLTFQRGGNSAEVGILNHVYWKNLKAELHDLHTVEVEFPQEERQFARDSYNTLVQGLRKLGYDIQKLPADESIDAHIMAW